MELRPVLQPLKCGKVKPSPRLMRLNTNSKGPAIPRPVRLTMMTIHNKLRPLAERRAEVLEMIDKAGREGTDILVLPECADHHRTHEAVTAHDTGRAAVREALSLSLD